MTLSMIVAGLVVFVVVALAVLGQKSRAGSAPGLKDGMLKACSSRPNCVNSEGPQDGGHFIAPLNLPAQGVEAARAALRLAIGDLGGRISVDDENYLAATFPSSLFGFVDDLEIRTDVVNQLIHVRSGSRVGYSDRDVNRKRVERFRARFDQHLAAAK